MSNPGLLSPVNSNIAVGSSSTEILAANGDRSHLALVNDSNETIYIAISGAAVMNKGIRLNSNGGSAEWKWPLIPKQVINGICASGSKNLTIFEGSK